MCITTETENETYSNDTVSETDSSETENETVLYGGKSKATFYRHLKNGPPVKRIKPWTVLGVSKAPYRHKAAPEPSVSILDKETITMSTAVDNSTSIDWQAVFAKRQEREESKARVLKSLRERPQPKPLIWKTQGGYSQRCYTQFVKKPMRV